MISLLWWLSLATVCLFICWFDLKKRVISNTSVLLLGLILVGSLVIHDSEIYLLNSALVLLIGFILWKLGVFGAGDVKLASVFTLFIHPDYQLLALVLVLVLGGLEALIYLSIKRFTPNSIAHDGLPFAIPIVCSGFFCVGASI